MTIERVYFFAPLGNQYGVIDYFTQEFSKALDKQGVETKIIKADRENPRAFLEEILTIKPDCTLSFNGLLPDAQGRFLCDMLNIPHFAYLTDAPKHFFPLVRSPNNIIGCIDQDFCQTFESIPFPHVMFLPHAASPTLRPAARFEPIYDVAMFNTYIDYEQIRQDWQKEHGTALGAVLDEAAEWVLADRDIPYMTAFFKTLDKHLNQGKAIDPKKLNHVDLLDHLEAYIGGKSRIELLKAIQDVPVHVFGSQKGFQDWKKYFGKENKNIVIHEVIPFSDVLEQMKKAKIVLNTTPEIKRGLHERLLSAMGCGAAVLALDTPFLSQHFVDEKEILLYAPRNWSEVNKKIHAYLKDEDKRLHLAAKGRDKVMKEHTWDQRAKTFLEQLPRILEKI